MKKINYILLLGVLLLWTSHRLSAQQYVVYEDTSGGLNLCNNIIVYNKNFEPTNISNPSSSNILKTSVLLFKDTLYNFSLRENVVAIDTGTNSCMTFLLDYKGNPRIRNDKIDAGAIESPLKLERTVVYQELGGTLNLCNNIIIYNKNWEASNIANLFSSNLIKSSILLFKDTIYNFSLREHASAVDMGTNSCMTFLVDYKGNSRIKNSKIDAGAIESIWKAQQYAVYEEDNGDLDFCNNIIINNGTIMNVNVKNIPTYNIIKNTTEIFNNNNNDFVPIMGTFPINQGYNACVLTTVDFMNRDRIQAGVVDIGAYEVKGVGVTYAALQDTIGTLNFYNNIIINNKVKENVNIGGLSFVNLIKDNTSTFMDSLRDFSLWGYASAINKGLNTYIQGYQVDMENKQRICDGTVDCGAYEQDCDNIFPLCPDFTDLKQPWVKATTGKVDNPYATTGVVNGRHTIITTAGYDTRTNNLLPLIPPGEASVVKLGNEKTGSQAESISYQFRVGNDNALLLMKFAVVLEDPNHEPTGQPRFIIKVMNSKNEIIQTCAEYDVRAASSIPGFNSYGSVRWRPWTNLGVDLTDHVGEEVKVQLVTYDCAHSGHYGYAYYTGICQSNHLQIESCTGKEITVRAPEGFDSYLWDNGNTTETSVYKNVVDEMNVSCQITSATGCQFTLYAYISPGADLPLQDTVIYDTICRGSSYSSNHIVLPVQEELGTFPYFNSYFNYDNCSSVKTTLFLTVQESINKIINAHICEHEDYIANGFTVLQPDSGSYTRIYTQVSESGCDSIVILNLEVHKYDTTIDRVVGIGNYVYNNQIYTESGIYYHTLKSQYGCDSVVLLELTIEPIPPVYYEFFEEVCDAYTWNNILYNESGDYRQQFLTNLNGDSIVTLHLTVNKSVKQNTIVTACDAYTWNNKEYIYSGIYTENLQTVKGCDSVLTLNLIINNSVYKKIDTVVCYSMTCGDEIYTETGTYYIQSHTPQGCTESIDLNLIVKTPEVQIEMMTGDLCENDYIELIANTNSKSILWSTGETTSSIFVNKAKTYFVKVWDEICEAQDTIVVPKCDYGFYIPNVITPGKADGLNDLFMLSNTRNIKKCTAMIFNRWGEMIYESKEIDFKWDGKEKGKIYQNNMYVYVIKIYFDDDEESMKTYTGSVLVL